MNTKQFWEQNNQEYAGDVAAPKIVELSKKYIGKRVLDVGAGSGALIHKIPRAIGIDIAPKDSRIKKASITKIPFDDWSFDTVFATEVFEHLDDETLSDGLAEIKRVLDYGGHLIITVPFNEQINKSLITCTKCGCEFHRWGHVRSFVEKDFNYILAPYGFKIISSKVLQLGLMTHSIWFVRWLEPIITKVLHIGGGNLYIVAVKEKYEPIK